MLGFHCEAEAASGPALTGRRAAAPILSARKTISPLPTSSDLVIRRAVVRGRRAPTPKFDAEEPAGLELRRLRPPSDGAMTTAAEQQQDERCV